MASKNWTGNVYRKWKEHESRFIDKLTKRDKKGENAENVDHVYNKYKLSSDGSKVWSF